jgi:hypothetical protein
MDFIEGLPKLEGCNSILVVVDLFSKYAHFLPLKHPFIAHQVAQLVLDGVVKLHGIPNPWCLIGTKFSQANFGESCSSCMTQH